MKLRLITLLLSISILSFSQSEWKRHYFSCSNNNTSITLPSDFHFPKYFEYATCTIASFSTPDTCVVSVLCGEAGELEMDSSYQVVDMMELSNGVKRAFYYSKMFNKHARKDYLLEYQIMYDGATEARKTLLDLVFDRLGKY